MGDAVSTRDIVAAYMSVGKEFGLPVLLDGRVFSLQHEGINELIDSKTVIVDRILSLEPQTYLMDPQKVYLQILNTLEGGLNFLLLHPAYDTSEMQAITIEHPECGSKRRQEDFDLLMNTECSEIIKKQDIKMITWRELRDKITRAK